MKVNSYGSLLKKYLIGVSLLVMSMFMLTGCDLYSLIGPGSDYGVEKKDSDKEDKADKEAYVPESDILTDEVIEKIDTLIQVVDQYYLYEYDEEAMVEAIYAAVLSSLGDPYSVYYTKEEYDSFLESASGVYCGIGVVVQQDMETGIVTAVKPYVDCPGYEAGIRPGDIILAVDGTEITGMDLNTAVTLIKGEEGTTVTITIYRDEQTMDFEVERRMISVQTIAYEMLEDNIGYIDIDEFDEVTADQFSKALDELTAQGMEGLIIDLRDNPGGLLDIVVKMLDEILPEGTIVSVKDKYGKTDEFTSDAATRLEVPLVVLINENSASASEIFAGAVKDYGVGTLVGKTTFGKGIVQTLFSLRDGTGVKITIEDYYTPSGESIHQIGVAPDVEVELPYELKILVEIPKDEDTQLQAALDILCE